MSSNSSEFDLLLEAPTSVEADMAREILAQEGIPTFMHGKDRDLAELGAAVHSAYTRPNLFVPKGRRAEAQAILDEAWDKSALSDEVALSVPSVDEPLVPRASSRRFWSYAIGVLTLVAVFLVYYHEFLLTRAAAQP
jgi:hypothetical protein